MLNFIQVVKKIGSDIKTIIKSLNDNTVKVITIQPKNDESNSLSLFTINEEIGDVFPSNPTWTDYEFTGWVNPSGTSITSKTVYDGSYTTISGTWKLLRRTVTLKFENGEDDKQVVFEVDKALGDLLPTPTKADYSFKGWFNEKGTEVTQETIYDGSYATLTASWVSLKATLTLCNKNGEANTTFSVVYGKALGELPTPTRTYYEFDGWQTYTGIAVDSSTIYDSTYTVLLAKWKATASGSTLCTGTNFKSKVSTNTSVATKGGTIKFCSIEIPSGVTTVDVSEAQDGSIVAWLDGTTTYVSNPTGIIYANSNSNQMFQNVNSAYIIFDNFDTSKVTTFYQAFHSIGNMKEIDFSTLSFDNVTNFAYCGNSNSTKYNFLGLYAPKLTDIGGFLYGHTAAASTYIIDFRTINLRNCTGWGYFSIAPAYHTFYVDDTESQSILTEHLLSTNTVIVGAPTES
jgi:uncharacterized repeat protein (TIGR02543 family)